MFENLPHLALKFLIRDRKNEEEMNIHCIIMIVTRSQQILTISK